MLKSYFVMLLSRYFGHKTNRKYINSLKKMKLKVKIHNKKKIVVQKCHQELNFMKWTSTKNIL